MIINEFGEVDIDHQLVINTKVDRPWKAEETRKNELVFIGRDLDEARMEKFWFIHFTCRP